MVAAELLGDKTRPADARKVPAAVMPNFNMKIAANELVDKKGSVVKLDVPGAVQPIAVESLGDKKQAEETSKRNSAKHIVQRNRWETRSKPRRHFKRNLAKYILQWNCWETRNKARKHSKRNSGKHMKVRNPRKLVEH